MRVTAIFKTGSESHIDIVKNVRGTYNAVCSGTLLLADIVDESTALANLKSLLLDNGFVSVVVDAE